MTAQVIDRNTDLASKESFAQMIWGGAIFGFFLIQAILWSVAIFVTSNDPSHRVIADYDQRAQSWDDHREQITASKALGWTAKIDVSPDADIKGFRDVTVVVTDKDNVPVELSQVDLTLFHKARAAELQKFTLQAVAPSVWRCRAKMKRSGKWQFEGVAQQGDNKLIIDQQQWLALAKQ